MMNSKYLLAATVLICSAGCLALAKQHKSQPPFASGRASKTLNAKGTAASEADFVVYKHAVGIMQQGQTALDHKHYKEAESLFRKAIDIHPQMSQALLLLAEVSERQGNWEQALQAYYTLQTSNTRYDSMALDPVTRMRYVLALVRSNRYADAVQIYNLALQQAPLDQESNLFPLHFDANNPDENRLQAAAHYVMGIKHPRHREAAPNELLQHLQAAIRLAPDWGKPHAAIGKMLDWQRQPQLAEVEYLKARQLGEPVESLKQYSERISAEIQKRNDVLYPEHRGVNGHAFSWKLNGEQVKQLIAKSQAEVLKNTQQLEAAKKTKEEAKATIPKQPKL